MNVDPLYKQFDSAKAGGFVSFDKPISDHIVKNINQRIELRPYQKEAINRYLYYLDSYQNRVLYNRNLLFNMATGSGKTLIMAALILDLYKRGYNKFVFFVNRDNIIQKTIENFINPESNKYLFADVININGYQPIIRTASTLNIDDKLDIYIHFTTIQKLHGDLLTPKENSLTLEDIIDEKIVLLSDEAHHINSWTLNGNLSKEESLEKNTWEHSVSKIFHHNPLNMLLEFTATIDENNPLILDKYHDLLLFKYDLKQFRNDKYSKEIILYTVDDDIKQRMLQAILISQYRRKIAEKHGKFLKPVILFKSKLIADSKINRDMFVEMIKHLKIQDVSKAILTDTPAIKKLALYLSENNISLENFIDELKIEFSEERIADVNDEKEIQNLQIGLNSLEDEDNQLRVIFAVEKLNEGWDVLNLFDIVRLYETRDGQYGRGGEYKPGKTTISEAQLIGRGARYWPFTLSSGQIKDQRKYDKDLDNELRMLEELYYHSKRDTDYLIEIRAALTKEGLMDARDPKTVTLKLKESFKKTTTYQKGVVYVNELIDNLNEDKKSISDYLSQSLQFNVKLATHIATTGIAFEEVNLATDLDLRSKLIKVADIPRHVIQKALDKNYKFYGFNNLKHYLPHLKTKDDFIIMLSNISIKITGIKEYIEKPNNETYLMIIEQVLNDISSNIETSVSPKIGSKQFIPVLLKDIFKSEKKIIVENTLGSLGFPMSEEREILRLDLSTKEWYAYEEDYGTSEEKNLIQYINNRVDELHERWSELFLVRNEKDLKLFSFKDGSLFMPDYLLLLRATDGQVDSFQVFIESKGEHLELGEQWKEDFLLQLETMSQPIDELGSKAEGIRIIGMPFYREDKEAEFNDVFDEKLKL